MSFLKKGEFDYPRSCSSCIGRMFDELLDGATGSKVAIKITKSVNMIENARKRRILYVKCDPPQVFLLRGLNYSSILPNQASG